VEKAVGKLMAILKRQRKSVSFWERPDSKMKKLAIIEEFTASLGGCGGPSLYFPRLAEVSPDVIAQDAKGRLVGIEVTQLASEEAVRHYEGGQSVLRDWTIEEVISEIEKRIKENDDKKCHGGPYADLLLLIQTDEPTICFNDYAGHLQSHLFAGARQLSAVYFLFSYHRTVTGFRCALLKTG
jgi:hypothetical protein